MNLRPDALKFILDPYTVARTVCFAFSRQFADGEHAVAYYRLEVVQQFGADSYCALLRETDRVGNVVARRGDFSEMRWATPEQAIMDVLTWSNNQTWSHGTWATEE